LNENQALILAPRDRRYTHSLPRVLPILFGAGFTVAVCLAAGLLLIRALKIQFDRAEQILFGFVAGAACVSTVLCGLCAAHLVGRGILLAGGLAAIAAGAWWRPRSAVCRKALPKSKWLYFAILGALFLLYFFTALAPEVSPDGSGYHLGNVRRIAENGGFVWDYHSIYSAFPQGLEMLFLVAYLFGGMPAAAMVHLAFLCALTGLLVSYGRRFGCAHAGLFAAVLVFGSPVVGLVGSSAYNDVALATCIYAVFYSCEANSEGSSNRYLILIGLLAGYCFAIKYTGWIALPYAMWRTWRVLPSAAVVIGPWILRNWLWIGNPVAPFLNKWFPNWLYTADLESAYLADLRHVEGFHHWWEVPLDLTIYGAKLPGFLGPVFLLAPLALLALRYEIGRKLLLTCLIFALPCAFNPGARFLIPGVPFLAMAMAIAMQNSPGALPLLAVFHGALALPRVMPLYCADYAWRLREWPVQVAEEPYIRRYVPEYWLKEVVERNVPKGQKIFSLFTLPEAYIDWPIVVGYESAEGMAIERGADPRRYGIHFLVLKESWNNLKLTLIEQRNGTTLYRID
jgi:hypothetical protein